MIYYGKTKSNFIKQIMFNKSNDLNNSNFYLEINTIAKMKIYVTGSQLNGEIFNFDFLIAEDNELRNGEKKGILKLMINSKNLV
ncbi:hypothetical protein BpHYR1_016225 [Brachionus plicatilis]|uniref:Uncharacterized protein n=1 Tax=Brachionus plicatilis TaxID=10195 RepID=A0A3M7RMR3_BRAPC|nr:hypothetical protein BpHYR1_016225 [Brachionus plicatilis]